MPDLPRTPSLRLDDRRALVTGGSSGIGAACAAALADAGAEVTIVARGGDRLEQVAAELRARGGRVRTLVLDVTDLGEVATRLARIESQDILVNCAGTNRPGPFSDATAVDYDTVMEINVRALYFVTQAFAKRLVAEGRPGSIINVSSQMGHVGAPLRSIYCASKHAVEGLTKALAVELAPHGIRVNAICPTFIETPMTAPYLTDDAFRTRTLAKIKLGRLGRPDDIMGAVLLLASDAGALMTGASLLVDGGWTAD
jgi:NAD(P)-dependent dehydrogenase (short-subunit alcohol dehydrogenase family)